jgi:hypothetical protein
MVPYRYLTASSAAPDVPRFCHLLLREGERERNGACWKRQA